MHGILSDERPGFKVSEHAQVLSHCGDVDLLLEVNNVSTDGPFVLEGFGNEGLSLSCIFDVALIVKHGFV